MKLRGLAAAVLGAHTIGTSRDGKPVIVLDTWVWRDIYEAAQEEAMVLGLRSRPPRLPRSEGGPFSEAELAAFWLAGWSRAAAEGRRVREAIGIRRGLAVVAVLRKLAAERRVDSVKYREGARRAMLGVRMVQGLGYMREVRGGRDGG